jgi:hypothetical protein
MTEIELTDAQRQALQAEQGKPIDLVDPATQQRYVLLAREQYERVRALLEQGAGREPPETASGIPPQMFRSQRAFWRELPALLRDRKNRGQWVAYAGDERIGVGRTSTALYQRCLHRGLQRGEFYVGRIEEREAPPWGSAPLERSLYEAGDAPSPPAPPSLI